MIFNAGAVACSLEIANLIDRVVKGEVHWIDPEGEICKALVECFDAGARKRQVLTCLEDLVHDSDLSDQVKAALLVIVSRSYFGAGWLDDGHRAASDARALDGSAAAIQVQRRLGIHDWLSSAEAPPSELLQLTEQQFFSYSCGDTDAVDRLRTTLERDFDRSPAAERAAAWWVLGRLYSHESDLVQSRFALHEARRLAQEGSAHQQGLAGMCALDLAKLEHDTDNDKAALRWLHIAFGELAAQRNLVAGPILRQSYIQNDDGWMGPAVKLASTLRCDSLVSAFIELHQTHGISDVLRSSKSLHGRSQSPVVVDSTQEGAADDIDGTFAAAWNPGPWEEFGHHVSEGQAVLQHYFFESNGSDSLSGVGVLTCGHGDTFDRELWKFDLATHLADKILGWNIDHATTMRDRHWQEISAALLPRSFRLGELPRRLIVCASKEIGGFPIAALPIEHALLGERAVVVSTPSVATWLALDPLGEIVPRALLLTAAEGSTASVDGVATEIRSLEAAGFEVETVSSLEDLDSRSPDSGMLVVASHGRVSNGVNQIQMPAGDWVDSSLLFRLRLPALVVFGSCWTGALAGHPSPLSVVPVSLSAGAQAVLCVLWDGDADVVASVLAGFYAHLPHCRDLPFALHNAKTACGDTVQGEAVAIFAH